jgi:hypothetical protein
MPQNKNLAWENLIMAKTTNGISEFDQKLLDIMNGRMTDVSEIAAVLVQADEARFVDVLNHLDRTVLAEVMDKLPENKRVMIAEYVKVRQMAGNIHQENDVWNVSAEEYVKNSENLSKWKVDLNGEEFKSAREVVDWMNVSDDEKKILMETAARKVLEESRTVKGLTEKQYKEAINYEIQVAVYMAATATAAVKKGVNPKVATQEAVNKFVAEGNKKNSLDVSVDAIAAYAASTHEWIEERKNRALVAFAKTKFGKQVEKIAEATEKELKKWDTALSNNKTIGEAYKVARKYAPVIGKIARGAAIGAGMLAVAHMVPAGAAVYAAYAVRTSTKPLLEDYKKAKAKDPTLGFAAYAGQNKIDVIKAAVGAVNMIVSGVAGYSAVGLDNLVARGSVAATMGLINAGAIHHRDKKNAAAAAAAGSTTVQQASWARALGRGVGNSAVGFGLGMLFRNWDSLFGKETTTIDMPGAAAADSTNVTDSTVVKPNLPEGISEQDKQDILAMLEDDCNCDEPGKVNANDCEAKIKIQEKAPETAADLKFWASRADMFVEDCDQKDLDLLFKAGKLNMDDFPGINSMEEFTYKFGLMRKMNLPHQRPLVEEIEEMLKKVQDVRCGEGDSNAKFEELMKMKAMHPDFAHDVANGMNSYDNRGHYLCEEPKRVVHEEVKTAPQKDPEPVKTEEPTVPAVEEEEVQPVRTAIIEEQAVYDQPAVYQVSFEDGEKAPKLVGKDYRNVSYDYKPGPVYENTVSLGGNNVVEYQFQDGVLNVTSASIESDEGVRALAEQLRGFPDVANPEQKAAEIVAKAGVYMDLAENTEHPEKIHGLNQWIAAYSKDLERHGIEFKDDGLGVKEGFDKQAAISAMNSRAGQENLKLQKEVSNAMRRAARGKDY